MKIMKIIYAAIVVFIFMSVAVPVIQAEEGNVIISSPILKKIIQHSEVEISTPENGFIVTEATTVNSGDTPRSATLVVVLYDGEGKLKTINTSSAVVGKEKVVLKAGVMIEDVKNSTYKYYFWNDLKEMCPIAAAPHAPSKLSIPQVTNSGLILNWEPSYETVDEYIVYRNGLEIGRVEHPRFADSYLESGMTYNYSVTAIKNNKMSTSSSCSATTEIAPNVTFDNPFTQKNLTFLDETNDKADAYTEMTVMGGRSCRVSVPIPKAAPTRSGMFYFAIQKNIISPEDKNVTFEVTYLDNGMGAIQIQYNAIPEAGKNDLARPVHLATRTNTNTWKTAKVSIKDANFRKAEAVRNCDFRIVGGVDTYISKVVAERTEYFDSKAPMADFTKDKADLYLMNCKNGNEFSVHANAITQTPSNVDVEVSYVDESGILEFTYKNSSDVLETVELLMTGTGSVKNQIISLSNVKFDKKINNHADFTFKIKNSDKLPNIRLVTVKKRPYQQAKATLAGDNCNYAGVQLLTTFAGDTVNTAANIGGRDCRKIERSTAGVKHFYFRVDDDIIWGAKDSVITISYTYFDEGNELMYLQYNSKDSAFKEFQLGNKTNTNTWLTKTITLNDAYFTNAQSTAYLADFRIKVEKGTLYMSDINVWAGKTACIPRNTNPTIFLASDSTCETLPTVYFPREGWGMELSGIFKSNVSIINKAKGGKSSKSFLSGADPTAKPPIANDKRIQSIIEASKPGDYLFIQFGHNDRNTSPERYTNPNSTEENDTSYRYNLKRFVQIANENGLKPVFLTSIRERKFIGSSDVLADDEIDAYRFAMKEVGKQLNVPVLDVASLHKTLIESMGNAASKELFLHFTKEEYPNYPANLPDNTHISKTAAIKICEFIKNEISSKASENSTLETLAKYLN